nr:nitrile hydratase subunit alpha [Streptomyces sp. NBC_00886]
MDTTDDPSPSTPTARRGSSGCSTPCAHKGSSTPTSSGTRPWNSSAETRYMVLPRRPTGTESLAKDELAAPVTRNALIGTAAV